MLGMGRRGKRLTEGWLQIIVCLFPLFPGFGRKPVVIL